MKILKKDDKILNKDGNYLKYKMQIIVYNNLQKIIDNKKDCSYLFHSFKNENLNFFLLNLDTSKVIDMGGMFQDCSNLLTIPQLNTSKVNNMSYMFYGCGNLQTIPQLDTSNVTDMNRIFYNCYNLQTIDITSMDKISSTSNTQYMCYNCQSLTKLIIRNMTVIPPLNTDAFYVCYHFTGEYDYTYNPEGLKDGRIYVPDGFVEQLKTATNWSAYADIIVPLSTLEE